MITHQDSRHPPHYYHRLRSNYGPKSRDIHRASLRGT